MIRFDVRTGNSLGSSVELLVTSEGVRNDSLV
jgi:hypothetical protein